MEGYIYILVNESLQPGYLKIGRTTRSPEQRAGEISAGTGVPSAYKVAYQVKVPDCQEAERAIHERLAQYRVSNNREFFRVDLEKAVSIVDRVAQKLCRDDLETQSAIAASREAKIRHLQRQVEELSQSEMHLRQQLISETVENQNKVTHLQREVDFLREEVSTTTASRDLMQDKLSRLMVSMRKRRWRRFFREARRWISRVLFPWIAGCMGVLVRPVATLISRVESAFVARISNPLERKAVAFALVFPLLSFLIIGSAAYYPLQTIALTLAIVALCAVKQMVEQALPSQRGTTSDFNREPPHEKSREVAPPNSKTDSPPGGES